MVVKLGDFGLSKVLDPEDLTSAMSSNVGTLTFKAPEFWDKKDDQVRYHRNVDVYAAGLTFTTMLQARQGRSLTPKAEGSLQHSETIMPIGLTAFSRMINKHPDINVVEITSKDPENITCIKKLIREMTHVSPEKRYTASTVEEILTRKVSKTVSGFSLFRNDKIS